MKISLVFSLPGLFLASCIGQTIYSQTPSWSKFQNGGQTLRQDLPTQWSPDENIVWSAAIEGYGQSTPIVAHEQIVVTSTSGEKKDNYHVASYSIQNGAKLWQFDLKNPTPYANTPMVSRAAPSAIATATGFIAFFEGGAMVALTKNGKKLWEKDLVQEYGPIEARHGIAASLEQDENHVFVWVERSSEPYIIALDKKSGKQVWKADGVGSTSWSSPRLIPVNDKYHLVCSAIGKIIGIDPATGQRLWEFDGIGNNSSCTPVPVGNARFLIGASDGRGETNSSAAAQNNGLIEITFNDQGIFQADFVWQAKKATSTFGSPVIAGDTAAIVNRAGVMYRLDLETGNQVSVDRTSAGGIWATPIVANDLIYVFGYKGTTSVISMKEGKEIAQNRCWKEAAKQGGAGEGRGGMGSFGGNVLYAAAPAGPYLIIRRGDRLFAIGDKSKE